MTVYIHQSGSVRAEKTENRQRLAEFLHGLGIVVDAPCGSQGTCGKCLVRTNNAPDLSANEKRLLSERQIEDGWRLACCVDVTDGMHVFIGNGADAIIQVEGAEASYEFNPAVAVEKVGLAPPTLEDGRDNWTRMRERMPGLRVNPATLVDLPLAIGENSTAVLYDGALPLAILSGDVTHYGIAVDIGTTTIVAYLIDLTSGQNIDAVSAMNEQRAYGADVISRAKYAETGGRLQELANTVRTQINGMTRTLADKNGVAMDAVYHMSFAGNTIMMHLFLGLPVGQIAVSPFAPLITQGFDIPARELGLLPPRAMATLLPSVAGYVGADTVAALLACGMDRTEETTLLVDIGTNGEMALLHERRLLCCSTAAGPAFEGAHIACGMGGVTGAIAHVALDGDKLGLDVIGGVTARGICGSGLVDAVAMLLNGGAIDETGRFDDEHLSSVHIEVDGKPAIRLAEDVYLAQKDIREVQLAKGAIAAGIDILMKEAGIKPSDIKRTCLAGGFGNHIAPSSACRIGILPKELLTCVEAVGNAAGSGARIALLDRSARGRAEDIRKRLRYIEVSARPDFQDMFVERMMFE